MIISRTNQNRGKSITRELAHESINTKEIDLGHENAGCTIYKKLSKI